MCVCVCKFNDVLGETKRVRDIPTDLNINKGQSFNLHNLGIIFTLFSLRRRTQTLDLEMMRRVFYHCAITSDHKFLLYSFLSVMIKNG